MRLSVPGGQRREAPGAPPTETASNCPAPSGRFPEHWRRIAVAGPRGCGS